MGELDDPHGSELSQQIRVAEGLSTSERSAKKVGLWPTATAGDAKASGSRTTEQSSAHPGISLTDAAVHGLTISEKASRTASARPTPTTQDASNHGGRAQMERNTLPLNAAAKVWATPLASEPRLGYQQRPEGMASETNQQSLTTEVFDAAGLRPPEKHNTNGKPREPSRMLNADWVWQLMGYPRDWAQLSTGRDLKRRETASFGQSHTPSGGQS